MAHYSLQENYQGYKIPSELIAKIADVDIDAALAISHLGQEWKNYYEKRRIEFLEKNKLHKALHSRNLELLRLVLKHGADPNQLLRNGLTPLVYCCYNHFSFQCIKLLVNAGADVNLSYSVRHIEHNQCYETADLLFTYFNRKCLFWLYNHPNVSLININEHTAITNDSKIKSILQTSKRNMNFSSEILTALIKNTVSEAMEAQSRTMRTMSLSDDWSTLYSVKLISLFLRHGMKPSGEAIDGYFSIHWAVKTGNLFLVKLLVEYNIDINIETQYETQEYFTIKIGRWTALNIAKQMLITDRIANRNHFREIVDFLESKGAVDWVTKRLLGIK